MKKLIVMGIVAMMVMGMAVAASAGFTPCDTWTVQMKATNAGIAQGTNYFGTKAGASDGYAQTDGDLGFSGATSGAGEIICTNLGVVTDTPDGRWQKDIRSPFTGYSQVKVWDLKAYINSATSGTITLNAWVLSSAKETSPDIHIALYDGVVTAANFGQATALWAPVYNTNGTSSTPQYKSDFAVSGFHQFTLVAYTIPEPGSMVAMFSGLIGLIGFGIRRRK